MDISTPLLLAESNYSHASSADCACPTAPVYSAFENEPSSYYLQPSQSFFQRLQEGFYLVFSPYSLVGPCVLNESAWQRLQHFSATPKKLSCNIDRTLAENFLVISTRKPLNLKRENATDQLEAWLHITNACNLDCPYCYVQKSSDQMRTEIGLGAVKQLIFAAKKNDIKRLKLKYAGGEATLHFSLVQELHQFASVLAARQKVELEEVILSNGVFIRPDFADWLANSQVKIMISLDGVHETHNQQRPTKGGGKSFDLIERTVDSVLLPRGIRPDISITLTNLNARSAADSVQWALSRNLPFSLNFYRQNMQSKSRQDLILEEENIIEGMLAAYQVVENHLPSQPFLSSLLDRVQAQAHTHTCGAGHSYVVITHTGKLAQCQMHLDQPISNTIDADNMLTLVGNGPIQNIPVDDKEGCRNCTFRYRCTGGCPIETFRATGRWDIQSPNCRIYTALFPEALRLEGLRLLKVNGYLN